MTRPRRVIVLPLCAVMLELAPFPAGAEARAGSACERLLQRSFHARVDLSGCDVLRLRDGRIIGVAADDGIYLQMGSGAEARFVWLDRRKKRVVSKAPRHPIWTRPIDGRQTAPDAKHFYAMFFLDKVDTRARGHPRNPDFSCPDPIRFLARERAPCF